MASAKRFPDGPAPPVLHYVVANLIGYVAVAYLYATLNDTPELWLAVWGQGYMVLACTFVAIVFSKIFSHRDCGGSPFFLLLFSASFQVCLAQVMVFVGWSSSGFNLDRFFSEWVGSSHPDNYWDVRVLWMFNAIMIKDMPWLIVYDCKLIGVHHVASCMGNFLVLHYQPDSARLMAVLCATVEFGSGINSIACFDPTSSFKFSISKWAMLVSNIGSVVLIATHLAIADWSVWWIYCFVATFPIVYLRHDAIVIMEANLKSRGDILKKEK
eukprot:m.154514 g.154514  ORF g.154514 m.154514 type:complete len:270 (+) comp30892_c0_seq2:191-1000(+)